MPISPSAHKPMLVSPAAFKEGYHNVIYLHLL